jgi:hypothetical protein
MTSKNITIDVSGRKFRTSKAVLSVSPYFESLLSRREDYADLQPDGSYYIDADPDTFEHLLNFMRRPAKFPLFWTKKDGFDYTLYSSLEAEVDYFMLEGLRDWIEEKKYLGAVKITQTHFQTLDMEGWEPSDEVSYTTLINETGSNYFYCPSGYHVTDSDHCYRSPYCKEYLQEKELVTIVTKTEFDERVVVNPEV